MSPAAEALQRRAEILKLARILACDPEELAYLDRTSLATLRELREQTTKVMWSANSTTFSRLAAASKLLPAGLTATIAQRAFGPLLAARLAGRLEPERAVEVASKLPTPFLADVAIELDPRRADALLALIPPAQIKAVTAELVRRGEHVTMGRFVGHLAEASIRAALSAMDDASLLRVGFVLEDKAGLPRLIALLPPGRLEGLILVAAEDRLWLEALDLLAHLDDGLRGQLVAGAAELDHAALEDIVGAVIEHELWEEVLVIAERDATLQAKLAERLPRLPTAQRRALADRAQAEGAVARLGPLGEALARAGRPSRRP